MEVLFWSLFNNASEPDMQANESKLIAFAV